MNMKNLADFLRQCDAIKDGACENLNHESLEFISRQLYLAKERIELDMQAQARKESKGGAK